MTGQATRGAPDLVVVTHQTREEALACLASARAAGAGRRILVDAGSTDGTVAAVRARDPGVEVLALDNVGFARAANAGIRRGTAPTAVVANADVRFAAGSLTRLDATLAAREELAAVGPRVDYPDGAPQASARRLPSPLVAAGHAALLWVWPANPFTRRYRALDVPADAAREVDWLSGCALALRRRAVEEIGGFDPGYFLYVEDVDLAVRLRARGWRLRYEPAARVTHRVGAATGRRRAWALWQHARSLDRYYIQHLAPGRVGRALRPLVQVALAAWVVLTLLGRTAASRRGAARSSTGEHEQRRQQGVR